MENNRKNFFITHVEIVQHKIIQDTAFKVLQHCFSTFLF